MASRAIEISHSRTLRLLQRTSVVSAVLAAVAAAWGVFTPGLYRDNAWAASQSREPSVRPMSLRTGHRRFPCPAFLGRWSVGISGIQLFAVL